MEAVAEEAGRQRVQEPDRSPDHEACDEPHQEDPEEGQATGYDIPGPDHPPGVADVVENPLAEIADAQEGSQGRHGFLQLVLRDRLIGGSSFLLEQIIVGLVVAIKRMMHSLVILRNTSFLYSDDDAGIIGKHRPMIGVLGNVQAGQSPWLISSLAVLISNSSSDIGKQNGRMASLASEIFNSISLTYLHRDISRSSTLFTCFLPLELKAEPARGLHGTLLDADLWGRATQGEDGRVQASSQVEIHQVRPVLHLTLAA